MEFLIPDQSSPRPDERLTKGQVGFFYVFYGANVFSVAVTLSGGPPLAKKSPLSEETWPSLNSKVTPGEKKEDPYEFIIDADAVKRKLKIPKLDNAIKAPKLGNASKKRKVTS